MTSTTMVHIEFVITML